MRRRLPVQDTINNIRDPDLKEIIQGLYDEYTELNRIAEERWKNTFMLAPYLALFVSIVTSLLFPPDSIQEALTTFTLVLAISFFMVYQRLGKIAGYNNRIGAAYRRIRFLYMNHPLTDKSLQIMSHLNMHHAAIVLREIMSQQPNQQKQ